MLPHWRHVPELVSCPGLGLCGVRERSRAWFPDNVARNSPAAASNLDFASLELQRFEQCSKNDRGELRATFIRRDTVAPPGPLAPSALVVCGAWWVLSGFARLLAVRAASFARRVDSKPARPCGLWCALCLG